MVAPPPLGWFLLTTALGFTVLGAASIVSINHYRTERHELQYWRQRLEARFSHSPRCVYIAPGDSIVHYLAPNDSSTR